MKAILEIPLTGWSFSSTLRWMLMLFSENCDVRCKNSICS
jgi:hypothetical protein